MSYEFMILASLKNEKVADELLDKILNLVKEYDPDATAAFFQQEESEESEEECQK